MGIVRTAQPSRLSLPLLNVDLYASSNTQPCGLSKDRKTLFGMNIASSYTVLSQSVDDGTTWTTVKDFNSLVANCSIQGVLETDDGEALVFANDSASSPGYVFKSSGWTASHTAATWTVKLTTPGGRWRPPWSMHTWTFGDDAIRAGTSAFGVITEYGAQTTGSGSQTAKGVRTYVTADYGSTWTQVLDLSVRYPGIAPLHNHNVAYDPYWDRIWLLFGDTTAYTGALVNSTPTKAQMLYSDDRGVTWTELPEPAEFMVANGVGWQSTTIAVFKDSLLIGSDNGPGFLRIGRVGYRQLSTAWQSFEMGMLNGARLIHQHIHQNRGQAGAPILAGHVSQSTSVPSSLYASLDGGETLTPVWDDPAMRASVNGVNAVYGPTFNGKVVAYVGANGGGSGNLLRGELLNPGPNQMDAVLTVTGDGATTAFTYAHGLSAAPTRLLAAPWKNNPITSVTADATNITVTFTTAPANALVVPVALRFAP